MQLHCLAAAASGCTDRPLATCPLYPLGGFPNETPDNYLGLHLHMVGFQLRVALLW